MKVDRQLIQALNALISERGIDVLELKTRELSLRLERAAPSRGDSRQPPPSLAKSSNPAPSPSEAPAKRAHCYEITAPVPGIYLDRHPLCDQPLAEPGVSVGAQQLIGFLKVGCLLLPLRSGQAGRIMSILAKPGDTLEFGSVVIRLETDVQI